MGTEVNSGKWKPFEVTVMVEELWKKCFFFLFGILMWLCYEVAASLFWVEIIFADQLTIHSKCDHLGLSEVCPPRCHEGLGWVGQHRV
jgi:hypothetical protein